MDIEILVIFYSILNTTKRIEFDRGFINSGLVESYCLRPLKLCRAGSSNDKIITYITSFKVFF